LNIYTYKNNGFCNGVKNALDLAYKNIGQNVYTFGDIVHNNKVINDLKSNGIIAVDNLDCLKAGDKLIIRAHGVPKSIYIECDKKGIITIDATCKYVRAIQQKAEEYHNKGYQIVIIGDKNHPEIIGINGWCNNSAIITDGSNHLNLNGYEKVLILFQTTFQVSKMEECLKNIEKDCVKTLEVFKSICYTTIDRQSFIDRAVSISDCIIVVGDRKSSNTNKLLDLSNSYGIDAFLVESAEDIDVNKLTVYKNISIIAGASTPKELTEEVLSKMFEGAKDDVKIVENNEEIKATEVAEQTQNSEMPVNNGNISEGDEFTQAVENMPTKYVPLRAGQKIKGTISHIGNDGISVSFGSKRDGFIPNEEIAMDDDFEAAKKTMNIGDNLDVMVMSTDKNVILSKKAVDAIIKDDAQIEGIKEGAEFSITVQKAVKGGLLSKLGSYIVFVPASHIRNGYVKNLEQYIGKKLRLIALDVDTTKKKIVASQKDLLNREKQAKEDNFWNNIEVGEIVEGKVMRFASFGAFVNVRGFDCLAHLTDLSWTNIKEPSEVLELNKTYEFVVLKLDRATNRVSVGYKQLQPHPWQVAAEKFAVGTIHQGKVARILPYGAFIELDKGIDGLLHISNISWDWIGDINQVLKIGDVIDVCVMDFDVENKRITLSRKATIEQPTIPVTEKED
jgi:(E)-4-hydroxy-3-methyl-but-2-enyl pyrophosphate reductase (IPP and DMAPP forming)